MTATTGAPKRSALAAAWVISIAASLFVEVAAVYAAVRILEFRTQLALPVGEDPAASPSALPSPAPTPSATPGVADERVPEECAPLFSSAITDDLAKEGLVLETVGTPSGGTEDSRLLELLDGRVVLECDWHEADGGVDAGIRSSIVVADDEVRAAAIERALAMRMTRVDQLGGVRYFIEREDDDGRLSGESHFFRDGLWFATHWYGYGPYGYTADLARGVFD